MSEHQNILNLLDARDQQAIDELDKTFGALCRSIATHALSDPRDVEEIVCDTFLAIWNSIPPEKPRSLAAYISRITRNLAYTRYRDNTAMCRDERLSVSLNELEACFPTSQQTDTLINSILITQTLNSFLASLSKINRIIFIRRYYCMDSTKDIAKLLGITDQSVRSRLLRMRNQLQYVLNKEELFV